MYTIILDEYHYKLTLKEFIYFVTKMQKYINSFILISSISNIKNNQNRPQCALL